MVCNSVVLIMIGREAYTKVLDVAQNLVIQGKVVGGDDVDASILLDLPMGEPQPLGLGEKVILGDLATPVCVCLSAVCPPEFKLLHLPLSEQLSKFFPG